MSELFPKTSQIPEDLVPDELAELTAYALEQGVDPAGLIELYQS